MAAFFFLLAIVGGIVVGDLVWENTTAGEVRVFNQTVTGYPDGWLLAMAAALGFLVGLLVVASVSSTKARRVRRRRLRSLERDLADRRIDSGREHARWLEESFGRDETAAHLGDPVERPSELSYEQAGRAVRLHDDP
jgi:hypothetical protein